MCYLHIDDILDVVRYAQDVIRGLSIFLGNRASQIAIPRLRGCSSTPLDCRFGESTALPLPLSITVKTDEAEVADLTNPEIGIWSANHMRGI